MLEEFIQTDEITFLQEPIEDPEQNTFDIPESDLLVLEEFTVSDGAESIPDETQQEEIQQVEYAEPELVEMIPSDSGEAEENITIPISENEPSFEELQIIEDSSLDSVSAITTSDIPAASLPADGSPAGSGNFTEEQKQELLSGIKELESLDSLEDLSKIKQLLDPQESKQVIKSAVEDAIESQYTIDDIYTELHNIYVQQSYMASVLTSNGDDAHDYYVYSVGLNLFLIGGLAAFAVFSKLHG